jgi:plastocyanin
MSRHALRSTTAALLLLVTAPAHAAATATVTIKNFDFAPMSLTVDAGTTVSWRNEDEEPHTVVSENGLFRSKAIDGGEAFAFKFAKPGTYKYFCTIHPRMIGTIVVR